MISSSVLCLVLALPSAFAFLPPRRTTHESWQLIEVISSEIAHDMAQVAHAANGWTTLELNNRLLDTLRKSLMAGESNIRMLYTTSEHPSDTISRRLSLGINQNQELIDALTGTGRAAPRFIGALALGITQILTDFTKMILTRY